jgi:ribosomal protein L40E
MTELLTESFCERCGTRYTFQTAAPKQGRLGRLRVMSKGLRRYVLDDDTTLEDAFADARSEEDRAISSHQLEAFHQTFNFCMSCRQYTCANCWNTVESRCLSCAPDLSREVMPAPFPDLAEAAAPGAPAAPEAWPEVDLQAEQALPEVADQAPAPPPVEDVSRDRLAAVLGLSAAAVPVDAPSEDRAAPVEASASASPQTPASAASELGGSWDEVLGPQDLAAADALVAETETVDLAEPIIEPDATATGAAPAGAVAAAAIGDTDADDVVPPPLDTEERAAAAAAATGALLGRFRPGQSLDDVIDAYEHDHPEEPIAAEPLAPSAEEVAALASAPTDALEPEPTAAELIAAELVAEEVAAEATQPAAEEVATPAAPAEPAPSEVSADEGQPAAPAQRRDDHVGAPVWTIVAPDAEAPPTPPTPAIQPQPRAMPQWPTLQADATPQWPTDPFTTSAAAARAQDVLWAASAAEVSQKAVAVRSCGGCGLSLSATARFCRRCGSRQD